MIPARLSVERTASLPCPVRSALDLTLDGREDREQPLQIRAGLKTWGALLGDPPFGQCIVDLVPSPLMHAGRQDRAGSQPEAPRHQLNEFMMGRGQLGSQASIAIGFGHRGAVCRPDRLHRVNPIGT